MSEGTLNVSQIEPITAFQNRPEALIGTRNADPAHESYPRPKFPKDDGFQAELSRRVAAYFRETGKPDRDCWQMYVKTFIILAWCAVSYWLLVFVAQTWWQAILPTLSLSCAFAAIGFAIQHDGGHSAYSRRPWINRLAARSLDLMGASSYLWHWKHHIFHHTYSNIGGHDTDIELGAILRVVPTPAAALVPSLAALLPLATLRPDVWPLAPVRGLQGLLRRPHRPAPHSAAQGLG